MSEKTWALVFSVLFLCALPVFAFTHAAANIDSTAVGDEAPSFVLRALDSTTVFLRDYCGTLRKPWINKIQYPVILSFFATWCEPCRKEMQILQHYVLSDVHKPLKLFFINVGEQEQKVRQYIRLQAITAPVLLDEFMTTAQRYGVMNSKNVLQLPTMVFINREGKIRYWHRGFTNEEFLINALQEFATE